MFKALNSSIYQAGWLAGSTRAIHHPLPILVLKPLTVVKEQKTTDSDNAEISKVDRK